jgi:hypothetical protein
MSNPETVVLIDLDGCSIDDLWRRHLCDWKNRRFEKYHAGIKDDKFALPVMREIILQHWSAGHKIWFTTARPMTAITDTQEQIKKFFGMSNEKDYFIKMRGHDQEGIPSADLKRDMFNHIRQCYRSGTVFYAYDDHGEVAGMYHDCGVQHAYLVNDRIMIDLNAEGSASLVNKVRCGESFQHYCYQAPSLNNFLYVSDFLIGNTIPGKFFHEISISKKLNIGDFYYIGDTEIKVSAMENITNAAAMLNPVFGDSIDEARDRLLNETVMRYDAFQQPVNLDHVSIDINRDEKARNEKLTQDIQDGWLTPDVANLPRILDMSAQTFSDRREIYGDSSDQFGRIMAILMEHNNFAPSMAKEHEMYMFFNHIVGKLVRFANSGFEHIDSIHDIINYAGLVECCVIGIDRELKRIEKEEGNESD